MEGCRAGHKEPDYIEYTSDSLGDPNDAINGVGGRAYVDGTISYA